MADWRDILIQDSGLSIRSINALSRAGFYTMGQVCRATIPHLSRVENFGRKGVNELEEWSAAYGSISGQPRYELQLLIGSMQRRIEYMQNDIAETERNIAHAQARLDA